MNVVTGAVEWEPIAYIPLVRKQKEPSADLRGRERRSAILQRVLYLAFRTTIEASHNGVLHKHCGKTYVAFPRLLLYMSDQPEEKAVLCLKGGSCQHPCSTCLVQVHQAGAPEALTANERVAVRTVERQLEGAAHKRYQRESLRRTELEAMESAHNRVPALAGMAGLTTAPFLLYKTIGFDALHVRLILRYPYSVCCVAAIRAVMRRKTMSLSDRLPLRCRPLNLPPLFPVCWYMLSRRAGVGLGRHPAACAPAGASLPVHLRWVLPAVRDNCSHFPCCQQPHRVHGASQPSQPNATGVRMVSWDEDEVGPLEILCRHVWDMYVRLL